MLRKALGWRVHDWRRELHWTICGVALLGIASMALAATAGPKSFASPEAGIAALGEAVKGNDQPTLRAILRPHGGQRFSSGGGLADPRRRGAVLKGCGAANKRRLRGCTPEAR